MKISLLQDFTRFLTPGVAEDLIKSAKLKKSFVVEAMTLKHARNAFYIASCLAIIAAIGVSLSGFGTLAMIGFTATLILGGIASLIALKIFHNQILKYRAL